MAKTLPTLLPPAHVVEVARCTMGAIDLDPYSNAEINHVVQASRYLERDEDMAIATGRHCYACTAGAGSSCQGAVVGS